MRMRGSTRWWGACPRAERRNSIAVPQGIAVLRLVVLFFQRRLVDLQLRVCTQAVEEGLELLRSAPPSQLALDAALARLVRLNVDDAGHAIDHVAVRRLHPRVRGQLRRIRAKYLRQGFGTQILGIVPANELGRAEARRRSVAFFQLLEAFRALLSRERQGL